MKQKVDNSQVNISAMFDTYVPENLEQAIEDLGKDVVFFLVREGCATRGSIIARTYLSAGVKDRDVPLREVRNSLRATMMRRRGRVEG